MLSFWLVGTKRKKTWYKFMRYPKNYFYFLIFFFANFTDFYFNIEVYQFLMFLHRFGVLVSQIEQFMYEKNISLKNAVTPKKYAQKTFYSTKKIHNKHRKTENLLKVWLVEIKIKKIVIQIHEIEKGFFIFQKISFLLVFI